MGDALLRAAEQGLVDYDFPARVEVAPDLYLAAYVRGRNLFGPMVMLRLDDSRGEAYRPFEWRPDEDPVDVMVQVGRVVEMKAGVRLDPARFFNGLADLLEVASGHHERRPAIQLFPPQWVLTTHGAVRYDGASTYTVGRTQLLESQTIAAHIASKSWADIESFEEAQMVASALFTST